MLLVLGLRLFLKIIDYGRMYFRFMDEKYSIVLVIFLGENIVNFFCFKFKVGCLYGDGVFG